MYDQTCLSNHNHEHQGSPSSTWEKLHKLHKWCGSAKKHFQMTNQQIMFKCSHKNYHFLSQVRKGRNLSVSGAFLGSQTCLSTTYSNWFLHLCDHDHPQQRNRCQKHIYGRNSADRTKPHFDVIFFVFLITFFGNF